MLIVRVDASISGGGFSGERVFFVTDANGITHDGVCPDDACGPGYVEAKWRPAFGLNVVMLPDGTSLTMDQGKVRIPVQRTDHRVEWVPVDQAIKELEAEILLLSLEEPSTS